MECSRGTVPGLRVVPPCTKEAEGSANQHHTLVELGIQPVQPAQQLLTRWPTHRQGRGAARCRQGGRQPLRGRLRQALLQLACCC